MQKHRLAMPRVAHLQDIVVHGPFCVKGLVELAPRVGAVEDVPVARDVQPRVVAPLPDLAGHFVGRRCVVGEVEVPGGAREEVGHEGFVIALRSLPGPGHGVEEAPQGAGLGNGAAASTELGASGIFDRECG